VYYRISHLTRFHYNAAVSEALMELRMHPRTETHQRCLDFQLNVAPRAQILTYRDYLGNSVHHFSLPAAHRQLSVLVDSIVEMTPWPEVPSSLPPEAWDELDATVEGGDFWEMLLPGHFARPTERLRALMRELGAERRDDPLSLCLEMNTRLYETFRYEPGSTVVDSPIDHALALRQGVCQDFAHIMIALLRELRIPARYVSGYLYHGKDDHDRSSEGATHAWLEAWLPALGWFGLDPTNNLTARDRHIRTAIGRDYADVPPTRGVFKGDAETKLSVGVSVNQCAELPAELAEMVVAEEQELRAAALSLEIEQQEQQQQQQQQQQQ
jgi:transglutaminase-like putative cysteine protease